MQDRALGGGGGVSAAAANDVEVREEAILALRQNMSHPGKVITIRAAEGQQELPYAGVEQLLVVADSSNNRYLIFDAATNQFIE